MKLKGKIEELRMKRQARKAEREEYMEYVRYIKEHGNGDEERKEDGKDD